MVRTSEARIQAARTASKKALVEEKGLALRGVKVGKGLLSKEAIQAAGLDWKVQARPYTIPGSNGRPSAFCQVVQRMDTDQEIGGVGPSWTPVQNSEAFQFMDTLFSGHKGLSYEQAGSFRNGQIVFLQLKIGQTEVAKDDLVDQYVTMLNYHNGKGGLLGCFTPKRLHCSNQLHALIKGVNKDMGKYGGRFFGFSHTKGILNRMKAAEETLAAAGRWYRLFAERARFLAKTDVPNKAWVDDFLTRLGLEGSGKKEGESVKDRRRETVASLFETGRGNQLESTRGTVWALYNGVTEYVDHYAEVKKGRMNLDKDEARSFAAAVGHTRRLKERAFDLAVEMAGKV